MLSRDFHDGNLISISTIEEELELKILTNGRLARVVVKNLERLRVMDFKEGNIVCAIRAFSGKDGSGASDRYEDLARYVYDAKEIDAENNEKTESFLARKVEEIRQGKLLILEVEPSYGAYLVAIGRLVVEE